MAVENGNDLYAVSDHLGANEAFELLTALKGAIEDFAVRSEKLNADFRHATAREKSRRENALADQARKSAAHQAETLSSLHAARASAEAKFERRKAWINRAYQNAKDHALTNIDNQLGARKYELQKTMLQAERDRQKNLDATSTSVQEFKGRLAAEQQALAELEELAQSAFRGYGILTRTFEVAYEKAEVDGSKDHYELLSQMQDSANKGRAELAQFRGNFLLRLFKSWPVWLALALVPIGLAPALPRMGINFLSLPVATAVGGGVFVVVLTLRVILAGGTRSRAQAISQALAKARRAHDVALEKVDAHYHSEVQRFNAEYEEGTRESDRSLKRAVADASQMRVTTRMNADEKTVRIHAINQRVYDNASARVQERESHDLNGLQKALLTRNATITQASQNEETKLAAAHEAAWQKLVVEWRERITPIYQRFDTAREAIKELFPVWNPEAMRNWTLPSAFAHVARFGTMKVEVEKLCDNRPKDKRLQLPGDTQFEVPQSLVYPEAGSILFETANTGHDAAIAALNNIILRLLSVSPPGRLNFTVVDPVGLGQNFSGVMHLADYEEQLINSRIWTQSGQIEQKLADLNEHMEKVIQMYLRNEYPTIADYNRQAGVIAEKYHFLVVADFPVNFTDVAIRRLLSIASSGAKCGVYLLMHWDKRQQVPQDFIPDELRKNAVCVTARGQEFVLTGKILPGIELRLEAPPSSEVATEFVHRIGQLSKDSSRVEVPFAHVAPPDEEIWTQDTTSELRVPIGRTGATKLQYLAIGKGTCQHGLVAGKTGSGKSTLFHVIITNLALWSSPDEVEFYLVDFKKGVEFKCYANAKLPHARVIAIESDREFGLSVLQRVDEELKRRGDLFRNLGVQDIPGYKRAGGKEPMPRCLLLIDEFQEFFVEDDKISQTASLLLDRIVRQGRAFGIHVLLGSQTLGGAYTVARTTLGQMVIRIALQCSEADAYLIMDDSNPAPRLLSRPGEGIYNDSAGLLEGNSPFQVVWLPDEVRESYLEKVRIHAERKLGRYAGPIVFEGNVPADVRENADLARLIEAPPAQAPAAPRIFLGAPNSIKGPTEAIFHRQSGNHLLIVGQRDEAVLGIVAIGLTSLVAQHRHSKARIVLCDATPPGTSHRDYLEAVAAAAPAGMLALAKPNDIPALLAELVAEMNRRAETPDDPTNGPVFLIVHGLQKFSKLRHEEDFSFSPGDAEAEVRPGEALNTLITEGARLGFHVILACDSYNNVNRYLSRKAQSEFEMRVLFQMSANDSASLIDNPKASMLGLHRALFYNAQQGHLETFRPYALPPVDWIRKAIG